MCDGGSAESGEQVQNRDTKDESRDPVPPPRPPPPKLPLHDAHSNLRRRLCVDRYLGRSLA